jgi:hypothetical protein
MFSDQGGPHSGRAHAKFPSQLGLLAVFAAIARTGRLHLLGCQAGAPVSTSVRAVVPHPVLGVLFRSSPPQIRPVIIQTISIEMRDLSFVRRTCSDKGFCDQSVNPKQLLFAATDGKLRRSITAPEMTAHRVTSFSCRRGNNTADIAKFRNFIMRKGRG